MNNNSPNKSWMGSAILGILLIIISIASLFTGVIPVGLKQLFVEFNLQAWQIFLLSRIPRLLALLCTGVGMATAGLIMQQLCMNKFVSPTTGATISSAQFGILLAIVFLPGLGMWGRILFSFGAAIAGTWIFVSFIQRIQYKDALLIPLVGIMFGNIISGITSFLAFRFEVTQQISSYLTGSFALITKGNYELVWLSIPLTVLAFFFANHFNIAGMGKDFAANLGVHYKGIVLFGLMICAMITASVVSVVGSISYIGLLIPNIVSLFKGDKIQGTLLDTALSGALFVLCADMISRTVIAPYELPIELVIGIVGSLLFITLLFWKLKNGRASIRLPKFGKEKACAATQA